MSEVIPIETFQRRSCTKCNGTGVTETLGVSNLRSRAAYCDCAAGRERRDLLHDEFSPARINDAREKLSARKPAQATTAIKTTATGTDDGYQGDF